MAFVQSKAASGTAVSSHPVTLDAAPTQGNLIVVCFRPATLVASVTNPSGYPSATSDDDDGLAFCGVMAYKVAGASEPATITFTTALPVNSFTHAAEFNKIQGSPLDKVATPNDPTGTMTTVACNTSGTLTQPVELAVAFVALGAAPSGSPAFDSGFTTISANQCLMGYKLVTATTALAPTATWSTARGATAMLATFKSRVSLPVSPPRSRRPLQRSTA